MSDASPEKRRFGETIRAYVERYEKEADWKKMRLPKPPVSLSVIVGHMKDSAGIVKVIAERCGLDRTVMIEFLETYPVLQDALRASVEEYKDTVEQKLKIRIDQGEEQAAKLFINSKLADRGYSTKNPSSSEQSVSAIAGSKKTASAKEKAHQMTPRQRVLELTKAIRDRSQNSDGDGED